MTTSCVRRLRTRFFAVWRNGTEKLTYVVRSAGQTPRLTGGGWLLWTIFGSLLFGIGPLVALVKEIHLWNDANKVYNQRHAAYPAPQA